VLVVAVAVAALALEDELAADVVEKSDVVVGTELVDGGGSLDVDGGSQVDEGGGVQSGVDDVAGSLAGAASA